MKAQGSHRTSSSAPEWVQLLAAAVVQQALCDACDPALPAAVRLEARKFLAGSADYRFWGKVAEGYLNGHAARRPKTTRPAFVPRTAVACRVSGVRPSGPFVVA